MNISVMSRSNAIRYCYQPHTGKSVMISISDPRMIYTSAPFTSNENGIHAILRLSFSDADRPGPDVYGNSVDESDLMTDQDAKRVSDFVLANSGADIIVHCDAGISRSAGVAAAIMKYLRGDDKPIFNNLRYCPNMWCYRKTLNAFLTN